MKELLQDLVDAWSQCLFSGTTDSISPASSWKDALLAGVDIQIRLLWVLQVSG